MTRSYLEQAIDDGGSGNAEVVRVLEQRLAELVGAPYALCVSSGTTALISALRALGVRPGDRVGVSSLGPAITGLAVAAVGATPVFLDCASPTSFGLAASAARRASRDGLSAAIAVPMWGYWDEDLSVLTDLRAAGIPIVVDAAQAPFLRLRQGLADVVDVVCLSLHSRKPLRAGEGGVCLTQNGRVAEKLLALRNCGQQTQFTGHRLDPTGPFGHHFGINLKINALGAAWCLAQLDNLGAIHHQHQQLREVARRAFDATGVRWVEANQSADVERHGGYGLVALCEEPVEALRMTTALTAEGDVEIDTLRYRYAPMDRARVFQASAVACPNAVQLTTTAVACRLQAFAALSSNTRSVNS
ncbi:aminotransferase class I/II-fold pyridoxal phosphate-dependent enzyme [Cryptosporangium sp. NPDC048952]|uniref:aminotransferase class I/II-fold pyridoxal phosphate-dependent enzyme n=1 Tax=Cryptosporangium sp. NPDC048952 TaxID=3363961 RepID=UPI003722DE2C